MLQKILFTSNLFCIFAYDTIKYILETWQLKYLSASLSTSNHILQKKNVEMKVELKNSACQDMLITQ